MELVKRVNEALTSHFPLGQGVDLRCQSVDVTVEQNEILALRRALAGEWRNCRPCRAHSGSSCLPNVRREAKLRGGMVPKAVGRRKLLPLFLTVAALAILFSSCSDSRGPGTRSLLVVGDSVATQSAQALIHLAPAGTTVTVDTVRPGTAPCDWNHGFTDPTDHKYQDFAKA